MPQAPLVKSLTSRYFLTRLQPSTSQVGRGGGSAGGGTGSACMDGGTEKVIDISRAGSPPSPDTSENFVDDTQRYIVGTGGGGGGEAVSSAISTSPASPASSSSASSFSFSFSFSLSFALRLPLPLVCFFSSRLIVSSYCNHCFNICVDSKHRCSLLSHLQASSR
jgi:hypothetical protein